MKSIKIRLSILLVVAMLFSVCAPVFASYSEYNALWLQNPVEGVSGFIYSSNAYGFIVMDYQEEKNTCALVNHEGTIIPQTEKMFQDVDENGYINYDLVTDNTYLTGVMDAEGNEILAGYGYSYIYPVALNRFCCVLEDENGYSTGIVDSENNIIVPFGEYIDFGWDGLIAGFNEEYESELLDLDGNVILPFGETENVSTLGVNDRYLYYDEELNKSYIRSLDGSDIAEIDGHAYFHAYDFVDVEVYDEATNTMTVYNYDLDGNLAETEVYEDFSGKPWYPRYLYEEPAKYSYDYINNTSCITDENGNIIYAGKDVVGVIADKYIWLSQIDENWNSTLQLIDLNGNVIVPYSAGFEDLNYCEELDVFGLVKDSQIYIMKASPVTVKVNDKAVEFDQNPIIKNGRTLVPLRAIFESLGATVEWDEKTNTVTSKLGDITVSLTIGSNILNVNDKTIELDVPAEILNGRTLVPARAVSEAFNCNVGWDAETYTVSITK